MTAQWEYYTSHTQVGKGVSLKFPSNRLWSFWDMLNFHADKFASLTSLLRSITLHLLRLDFEIKEDDRNAIAGELETALKLLDEMGLRQSAKKARKISRQTGFAGYDARHFSVAIDELNERIKDELEDMHCLCLNANESALYAPKSSLVGLDVEAKFPSILYEIDESAKCAGLGRDTASAFHAIRCLEAVIRAISRSLNIDDPTKGADRSWFNLLSAIKVASEKKWPNSKDRFSGDGKLFEEFHADLQVIQNPYRNATMHLDAKYSRDEAEIIRIFVRALLIKVASRMDENGLPLA